MGVRELNAKVALIRELDFIIKKLNNPHVRLFANSDLKTRLLVVHREVNAQLSGFSGEDPESLIDMGELKRVLKMVEKILYESENKSNQKLQQILEDIKAGITSFDKFKNELSDYLLSLKEVGEELDGKIIFKKNMPANISEKENYLPFLKRLIGENETDKALTLLMEYLEKKNSSHCDDFLVLQNRWKENKSRVMMHGPNENLKSERSVINQAILDFINKISPDFMEY